MQRRGTGPELSAGEKQALVVALIVVALGLIAFLDFVIGVEGPAIRLAAAAITALGIVLAAVLTALLSIFLGYRRQKRVDRVAELKKQEADSYVQFLSAFWKANEEANKHRGSPAHEDAKAKYITAFNEMALVGSKDVLEKASQFHSLVSGTPLGRELNDTAKAYAEMLLQMRQATFKPAEDVDADLDADVDIDKFARGLPIH